MAGDSDEHAPLDPIEATTENADYVSNRNSGSRAMWSAKAEEEQRTLLIQYSLAEDEKSVLDMQNLVRFYVAIGEMKVGKRRSSRRTQMAFTCLPSETRPCILTASGRVRALKRSM